MNTELLAWKNYFLLRPGLDLAHDPSKADVILGLAFGRNTIPDSEQHEIIKLHEQSNGFDYLTIAKLKENNFDPGLPNLELATICQKLSDQFNLPLVIQWELATALDDSWLQKNMEKVICIWPPSPKYFGTPDVLRSMLTTLMKKYWFHPLLVAHEHHLPRAYLTLANFNLQPIVVSPHASSFDPLSVQPWTRNKTKWKTRELRVRMHHLVLNLVPRNHILKSINNWLNQPVLKNHPN